ncbi:hypothetical protein PR048_007576 [Dryococelus australis]|uniref:Uncharacterized protein n=1 Tax=Dryococelus australis TaxID=614101 RepID=A0ABQ9HUL6_9NEOP|nr:hypothetical protein PR048_007576 [Dryococelus australis]
MRVQRGEHLEMNLGKKSLALNGRTESYSPSKVGNDGFKGKRDIREKTRRSEASSWTIPTCENPGVNRPGIEPFSPCCEASGPPAVREVQKLVLASTSGRNISGEMYVDPCRLAIDYRWALFNVTVIKTCYNLVTRYPSNTSHVLHRNFWNVLECLSSLTTAHAAQARMLFLGTPNLGALSNVIVILRNVGTGEKRSTVTCYRNNMFLERVTCLELERWNTLRERNCTGYWVRMYLPTSFHACAMGFISGKRDVQSSHWNSPQCTPKIMQGDMHRGREGLVGQGLHFEAMTTSLRGGGGIEQRSPWAVSLVVASGHWNEKGVEDGSVRASTSAILISLRNHEQDGDSPIRLYSECGWPNQWERPRGDSASKIKKRGSDKAQQYALPATKLNERSVRSRERNLHRNVDARAAPDQWRPERAACALRVPQAGPSTPPPPFTTLAEQTWSCLANSEGSSVERPISSRAATHVSDAVKLPCCVCLSDFQWSSYHFIDEKSVVKFSAGCYRSLIRVSFVLRYGSLKERFLAIGGLQNSICSKRGNFGVSFLRLLGGDRDMHINSPIASMCKAMNCRAVLPSITHLYETFSGGPTTINLGKSEAIVFTHRLLPQADHRPELTLFGELFALKYFGVHVDRMLTWKAHINAKCPSAQARLSIFYPILNPRSTLTRNKAVLLYTMLIRPVITHAAPSRPHAAKTHIRRLQIIQNKCLRIAADAPRYCPIVDLHRDLKIEKLDEHFVKLTQKFYTDCANSANTKISNLGDYNRRRNKNISGQRRFRLTGCHKLQTRRNRLCTAPGLEMEL